MRNKHNFCNFVSHIVVHILTVPLLLVFPLSLLSSHSQKFDCNIFGAGPYPFCLYIHCNPMHHILRGQLQEIPHGKETFLTWGEPSTFPNSILSYATIYFFSGTKSSGEEEMGIEYACHQSCTGRSMARAAFVVAPQSILEWYLKVTWKSLLSP